MLASLGRGRLLACAALTVLVSGCATPAFDQARALHHAGDSAAGLSVLISAQDTIPERDQLLLLLEQGTLELFDGQSSAAARQFVSAADYIDAEDRISLRDEARALVTSEATTRYTGEYAEQLLAHSHAMLGFLLSGQAESAAVEARRAGKRLREHEDTLDSATFTRALMALSFEMAGQTNDAYVSARALPAGTWPATAARLAQQLGSSDADTLAPSALNNALASARGELVLAVATGQVSTKYSSHLNNGLAWQIAFPAYRPVDAPTPALSLQLANGKTPTHERASTNINQLLRQSLDARAGALLARQSLRLSAKHNLAKELRAKDELGAQLLAIALFVSEVADTRGWYSLPARFDLYRVAVPVGADSLTATVRGKSYTVDLNALDYSRGPVLRLMKF